MVIRFLSLSGISNLLTIFTIFVIILSGRQVEAQTVKVYPGTAVGSGVTYGTDVKLTLFRITNHDAVNQKFRDLGMDVVRVPVVAHWGSGDNRYGTISSYANNAKGKGLNIFASIANSNGLFKPNGDLDDAHNGAKFPAWMKCASAGGTQSCNSSQKGLYGIKLPKYRSYLQNVVVNMIGNASWVGPWNEDNAAVNDYSQLDWGMPVVGAELWNLANSDQEMAQVGGVIDIGGAHHYDNNSNLLSAYTDWNNFRTAGGDWFTESTLFAKSTAQGIAHILPAISGGMKKVLIYQGVPRLVSPDGTKGPHYDAVDELIKNSVGMGAARKVEVNHKDYVAAAFKSGSQLHLHVVNAGSTTQTVFVNLKQGYTVSTSGFSVTKYGGNTVGVTFANAGAQIKVNLSPKTYARVTLNGLFTTTRVADTKNIKKTGADAQVGGKEILSPCGLFPNPVTEGKINLKIPGTDPGLPVEVTLFTKEGKKVFEKKIEKSDVISITVDAYLKGLHFLHIVRGDLLIRKKLLLE